MRWLKYFEGYLDKYYEEIDKDEYEKLCDRARKYTLEYGLVFSESQMLEIYRLTKDTARRVYWSFSRRMGYHCELVLHDDTCCYILFCDDSYYGVRIDWFEEIDKDEYDKKTEYFNCDQWEGLLKLLKDKDII